MLCWSLQRGNFQMGRVERTPNQGELLSYEWQSEAPAEGGRGKIADLCDDSDRLAAARGRNHSKLINLCFALSIPGAILSLGTIFVPIEMETLYLTLSLTGGGLVAIGSLFGFLAFLNQPGA